MTKRKRPRGSRGARDVTNAGGNSSASGQGASDLMVLMPTSGSLIKRQLQIKEIINRLAETGFSQMALVHTIYGRPKPEDRVDTAMPKSLWETSRTDDDENKPKDPPIRIYRRLHVVLENLSDVGLYMKNQGLCQELLKEYDLISVCPRNEGVFQSACATASVADIVTLDYSIRGTRLPYKIRPADIKAVTERGMAVEIPLVPALLHTKQRKALVQTSRELQRSCAGMKPTIIFGSGDRTFEESDVGTMGFRMPGDITNLLQTVLHFDAKTAKVATGAACEMVIRRAQARRWGESDVSAVFLHEKGKPSALNPPTTKEDDENSDADMNGDEIDGTPIAKAARVGHNDDEASDDPVGDGFIQF
ncbi:unnamed protein product [Cylindrotheca closterium]|uniref:Uncharacterized protein n=1 Tax=Cylindrotheca closterium TaxID=2856 RepID=A0AAD2JJ03_9STRA|nr:unnamed protein product [Cylindrotheca closterium]